MVWAAVILAVLAGLLGWSRVVIALNLRDAQAELADRATKLAEMNIQAQGYLQDSNKWQNRYENLVEKLRLQAAKPDDGIIHAKNSGDVRRLFEQQVNAEQMKREKQQEN